MLRFGNLVFMVAIGVCLTKWTTASSYLPASTDPCSLTVNQDLLEVTYGGHIHVCGMEVGIEHFSNGKSPAVTLSLKAANEGSDYYTLVMVDMDAPTRSQSQGYFLHWLVINIKKDDIIQGYNSGADVKMDYTRPAPPKHSDLHRYQFFVFEQPRKFKDKEVATPSQRSKFDLKNFLEQNKLIGPKAGYQIKTGNM